MAFRPLNIVGGWYTDDALPWVQQDICNYIPVISEMPGPISAIKAVDAPGPKPFVEIASDGGIRGMRDVEGKLMVVAGTRLYQITNNLVAIPCGTIPGSGPVTMSHNQAGIANELLVGNGSAGYVYNTSTLDFNRITDPAFPGSKASDYLDSYLLGVEPLGRFWYHSNLANAESYNSLDRYESETAPDRIVTLKVSNEEAVVFNQGTTDFFVNTGAATGTFQSKGVSCNVGCAGTNAVVKLDNTLMWLDNYGVFQRLDGYTPVPISTRALESAIAQFKERWAGVVATTYQDRGRKIAYWTFPNSLTFGYDVTTRLWHRLASYGRTNFRAPQIVYWNKKWIAGDAQTGRLYELDWDYMLDVDQPHVRKLRTASLHGEGAKLKMHAARLVFDTGGPVTVPVPFPVQPPSPSITGTAPDGVRLLPYGSYTYPATGGTGVLTVTRRPGSVDIPGLTFDNGTWTGTPTTEFTEIGYVDYVQTIRVTDENGLWSEITDTIRITAALLGFTTENYLFTGPPSALVESIPTALLGIVSRSMSISPNSLYIAAGSTSSPWLVVKKRREDGTGYNSVSAFADMPTDDVSGTAFSPNGQFFACLQNADPITLRVYRIGDTTFDLVDTATGITEGGAQITWSPDSSRIAVPATTDGPFYGMAVFPFDRDTETLGTPVYADTAATSQPPTRLNWHPSGDFMAQESNNNLIIWDTRVDPIVKLDGASPDRPSGRGAVWSIDGDYVYSVAGGGGTVNPVAIYGFSGSSLSAAVIPTDQPTSGVVGVGCTDSSISADGGSLAIGMASVSPSVFVYQVLGSDLQAYATQPTTTQNVSNNVVFTGSGLSE